MEFFNKLSQYLQSCIDEFSISTRTSAISRREEELNKRAEVLQAVEGYLKKELPLNLSDKDKIAILKAELLVRIRTSEDVDDVIKAIECIKADISSPPVPKKSQRSSRDVKVIDIRLPVVSELGRILDAAWSTSLLGLVVVLALLLIYRSEVNRACFTGRRINESTLCKGLTVVNEFFDKPGELRDKP